MIYVIHVSGGTGGADEHGDPKVTHSSCTLSVNASQVCWIAYRGMVLSQAEFGIKLPENCVTLAGLRLKFPPVHQRD